MTALDRRRQPARGSVHAVGLVTHERRDHRGRRLERHDINVRTHPVGDVARPGDVARRRRTTRDPRALGEGLDRPIVGGRPGRQPPPLLCKTTVICLPLAEDVIALARLDNARSYVPVTSSLGKGGSRHSDAHLEAFVVELSERLGDVDLGRARRGTDHRDVDRLEGSRFGILNVGPARRHGGQASVSVASATRRLSVIDAHPLPRSAARRPARPPG